MRILPGPLIALLGFVSFLASSSATYAQSTSDIAVEITNFYIEHGRAYAVVEVTNNGTAPASSVFVTCPFYSKDKKTLSIGSGLVTNLAIGQTKHDRVSGKFGDRIKTTNCYVDKANF